MDLTSTLSPSLKLIISLTQLSQTQFRKERSMQIVASPRSQKLLIVPLLNLLEALVCVREVVIQPRCFHYSALSSFLPPITFRLSVTVQSGKKKKKKRMCNSLAVTQELMKAVIKFPGFGTKYVSLCTVDVWGWVAVFLGDPPVCCRALSSVPGLYGMCVLSCIRLFATPGTVALQAPPSMGFCRQEY